MMIDFSLYLLALPFVFLALPLFLPKRDKQLRNLPKVHLTRTLDMKDKMQEAYRKVSSLVPGELIIDALSESIARMAEYTWPITLLPLLMHSSCFPSIS